MNYAVGQKCDINSYIELIKLGGLNTMLYAK